MTALAPHWEAAFEQHARRLPTIERLLRQTHHACFAATGFPGPADEDWHYTDLADLGEIAFALADPDFAEPPATLVSPVLAGTERLVYRNGGLDRRHTTGATLDRSGETATIGGDDGVDALNAAYARRGLNLTVARGQRAARPIHLLTELVSDDTPLMQHTRHRLVLEDRAEATLLVHAVGRGDAARLQTQALDIRLGAGARLHLHLLSDEGEHGTQLSRIAVQVGRDARLALSAIDFGAGRSRSTTTVTLAEPGADAEVLALCMPGASARVDHLMRIVHASPQGRSRMLARGVLDGRAVSSFTGRVIVRPQAQKTDSEQRLANLLLSRRAQVNAKPDLEIHADDVKCAHGATVGQLDAKALAYLRSRGIAADVARGLLVRAFATDLLERLRWPTLEAALSARLGLPPTEVWPELLADTEAEARIPETDAAPE